MSDLPGLSLRVIDLPEPGQEASPELRAWGDTVSLAFRDGTMSEERHRVWRDHVVADRARVTGVWDDEPAWGASRRPVATFCSFAGRLNVDGDHEVEAHMITDVTVTASHRRRGLMARMMRDDLDHAASLGRPLAVLTVSEGTIYERFGFGPATRVRQVEVVTTGGLPVRGPASGGRVSVLDPAEAYPAVGEVWAAHQASTRGSLDRPAFYRPILDGSFSWDDGGPDRKLQAALHVEQGRPTGYVLYRHDGEVERRNKVVVVDLATLTPDAERGLWRHLGSLDLVDEVHWGRAPVEATLDWVVEDPRRVRTVKVRDLLWVRVLDVAAALTARPWVGDGALALDVSDPLGHAAGLWAVDVEDGVATVTRVDEPGGRPVVDLDVAVLGSWLLGDVDAVTLHAAGRLTGDAAGVARLHALGDLGPRPWCTTAF